VDWRPDPFTAIKGVLLLRGGKGRREGGEGKGEKGKGKRRGRERRGNGWKGRDVPGR